MTTMTATTALIKTANTPFPIPCVTAEGCDPTDRYYEEEELDGPDRRWSAFVDLKNITTFEEDTEAVETESFSGRVQFDIPTDKATTFWKWCADNNLTLADLQKGITYSGITVEWDSDLLLEYSEFTDEVFQLLEGCVDRDEFHKFVITDKGCALFVG